jgi:hypothetical protein
MTRPESLLLICLNIIQSGLIPIKEKAGVVEIEDNAYDVIVAFEYGADYAYVRWKTVLTAKIPPS